ncbi:MAG: AraC family transcriptional regulator [Verrucomicrobiota bacterium]
MSDRMRGEAFQARFFARHPNAMSVMELFEYVPNLFFYAKDTQSRYVRVNGAVLRTIFDLEEEADILGRTDREIQPPALAEAYLAEDRRVIEGKKAIPSQVWLVPPRRGGPQWYVSTKVPLFGRGKDVLGIAGVMYPIATPQDQEAYFREMAPVIRHMDGHYRGPVSMGDMAELAGMSATHFNRRFRAVLKMSPTEYLLKRRVQAAQGALVETSESVGEIAVASGFYDQSQFTKIFRRVTGMTPLGYRKRFRAD